MKILIVSPQTWTNHFVSKQYYAIHLKRMGHDVFFLNPIRSVCKKKFNLCDIKREGSFGIKIVNLKIFYPLFLKKYTHSLFNLFQKLSFYLFKYKTKLKFDLVWSFDEENFEMIDYIDAKKKIIHIVDPIINKEKFIKNSSKFDLAIFISELFKIESFAKKNLVIPHGLNLFFSKKKKFKINEDSKLKKIALYGNFLSGRFDLNKIKYIIEKNNNIIFTLIGNSHHDHPYKNLNSLTENTRIINALKKRTNVRILENIGVENLPKKISGHHLFLTILKKNYNVNAHKLLEIISTGKPMISSYFDFYKNNLDLIYFPKNHTKFAFQVLIKKIFRNYKKYFNKNLFTKRIKYSSKFNYDTHINKIFNEIY